MEYIIMDKKFTIIQFDEDENYFTVAELICFNMGLEIAATAKTVAQSKKLFEEIQKGNLKPDIAIVNSFLERDHRDGSFVAKKLRELVPDIKIIGFTIIPDEDWADMLAIKSNKDNEKTLIKALAELTGKEFHFENSHEPEPD